MIISKSVTKIQNKPLTLSRNHVFLQYLFHFPGKTTSQASASHGGIAGYNQGTVGQCTFAGTLTKTFTDPDDSGFTAYCYGGITGFNSETANLSDNLVIGATIPRTKHMYGSVAGYNGGNLAHNYYINCTVDGTANATGVGCFDSNFTLCDITENDGAVPGNRIFLAEHITSDATVFTIPTVGEIEEQTFSVAAFGATVTLGYEPSGYEVTYYVDEAPIEGNTFTMPNAYVEAVVVNATVSPAVTLDIEGYGTSDGGWNLIASPLAESVAATAVGNLVAETASDFDLYRFNQAANMEWENWKNEDTQLNHYHFDLGPGRGYLYAHQTDVTLIFTGEPYSGNGEVRLSKNTGVDFEGWNLVGNPFNDTAYIADGRAFYTMNAAGSEIIADTTGRITPMEGIFVQAEQDGEILTFTTEAPGNNGKGLTLNISQGGVVIDRAIVRFGDGGMLPKFQMKSNSTKLYIPQDNGDYAVISADNQGEMPVSFKAKENGTYTLTISGTLTSQFSTLNLIDNLTGAVIDLLAAPSYTFEAKTTDNTSRFKLVFSTGENVKTQKMVVR